MSKTAIPRAYILGCSGLELTPGERSFFRYANPLGFIIFQRNIQSPEQVRRLVSSLREAVGRADAPILIDHEGGRIQRLRPPVWPQHPAPAVIGGLYAQNPGLGMEAARLLGQLLAADLHPMGIDVNCAPVADLRYAGASPIFGDRCFAADPEAVTVLCASLMDGLLAGGVLPVLKHLPGHGRAVVDPHDGLPVLPTTHAELARTDFVPFQQLAARAPLAMTGHVTYPALDPELVSTLSPIIINDIIRGEIGFQGLLMSDDIGMRALSGRMEDIARQTLRAGVDLILHCSGKMDEMMEITKLDWPMTDLALVRWERAQEMRAAAPAPADGLAERLDMLLGVAALAG